MNLQKIHEKLNETMYDYIFQISSKEFHNYKKSKFHGTYLVNWGKGKITREII